MKTKFFENFLDLCQDSGMNQTEIARTIGINQSQVSRYMKGVLPDTNTVVKICDYFQCSVDYMIGLSDQFNYSREKMGVYPDAFFPEYDRLLKQNNITHYQLAKRKIVCETSLRLWKKGTLPNFEVLCDMANELGGSVDKLLGKTD